jgi:hypothetical protein
MALKVEQEGVANMCFEGGSIATGHLEVAFPHAALTDAFHDLEREVSFWARRSSS